MDGTLTMHASSFGDSSLPFNYEFLIYVILAGVLTVFFLLYFNRLFGSIVSYAIRFWTWRRYRVYIDIQALQISLLGGRIFFTGLRYHGSNETFLVQHGNITWRYWLRRVRDAEIYISKANDSSNETESQIKNANLPCRIEVNLVGLEWFVYNRSPAYDGILAGIKGTAPASTAHDIALQAQEAAARLRKTISNNEKRSASANGSGDGYDPRGANKENDDSDSDDDAGLPAFLEFLPIHVRAQKAALVVGNDNTKGILIVKADSISGHVDASATKTCDKYRQLFNVDFQNPVIEIRDNEEYREDQSARATKEREPVVPKSALPKKAIFRHRRRQALHALRNMVPYWRGSVESFTSDSRGDLGTSASHQVGNAQWQGLSRYLEDRAQDDRARWASVEYAAETTILDSPSLHFTMYWDSGRKVMPRHRVRHSEDSLHHVNGCEAPGWGVRFVVGGGVVNYGPWADRHRAELQRVFAPGLAKDATPAQALEDGAWRVATEFKVYIELVEALTLRVPIREESKNWRWRGKEPPVNQQTRQKRRQRSKKKSKSETTPGRPSGWLEFKIPPNATVDYSMDMLARKSGYRNTLHLDMPNSELWSSVNHDVLWRSDAVKVSCDLSNPLTWNTLRDWKFGIKSDNMKLFILRDHVFLLTDLVNDWASGPPSDYLTFTPYNYHINIDLQHLELLLNVNDGNIIDNATSLEDNTFLIISTPKLGADTKIALDKFRPEKNAIPFDIACDTLSLNLNPAQSNTEAAFLASREIAHADHLAIDGSYHYNAGTSPANTDTLELNIHGQSPTAYLYGFLIRYALLLKDNYFGDHVHFRTLAEYQEQLQPKTQHKENQVVARPPPKSSNDLDIMLSVKVDDPQVLIPTNIYSASTFVMGELASLAVDLRFTNYYMDLELDLSPLSLSSGSASGSLASPNITNSTAQLFIDGIRVFGHRAFGLPPSEPTYLCNWDVSVGNVKGNCTADFLSSLARAGAAFAFTFDDVENALVPYSTLIFYDITFIRITVSSLFLWITTSEGAFLISSDAISVSSNDWARTHYSRRANIDIPNLQVSCVDLEAASKHTSSLEHPVQAAAFLRTDIRLSTVGRKLNFQGERKTQQELVRREDQRTGRTPFLMLDGVMDEFIPEATEPPAQCAPPQPYPVDLAEDESSLSGRSSRSKSLRSKSSFLSLSSYTEGSIRRSRSYVSQSQALETTEKRRRSSSYGKHPQIQQLSPLDANAQKQNHHSSIGFSSPYFAPHFNLDGVPLATPVIASTMHPTAGLPVNERPSVDLDAIDPDSIDQDYLYSSVMVEFPIGITAYVTPNAIRYAVSAMETMQPSSPEDILDSMQTETLGDIFSAKKKANAHGTIKDLMLRLPEANVRLVNSTKAEDGMGKTSVDRYDLEIKSVDLISRTKSDTHDSAGVQLPMTKSKTSLQLRVDSVEASAGQYTENEQMRQTALMARINNILVTKGVKDITYLDVDVGSILGSTASGNIEYLATLIHRSGNVASELGQLISDATKRQSHRLMYCYCHLLGVGAEMNDPSFLIRPSAVLRSVDQHLRTVDSWKLMMRLRQIWTLLDHKERAEFTRRCGGNSPPVPPNAGRVAVDAFKKWRSWDLEDLENASLLKKVFPDIGTTPQINIINDDDEQPFLAAARLGQLQFTLDPGPRENKVSIKELNARLEKKTDHLIPTLFDGIDHEKPLTIVNFSLEDVSVGLNWEIYELAEIVLRLSRRASPLKATVKKVAKKSTSKVATYNASHVFVDIRRVSIDLEAINLRARTMVDELKSSVVLSSGVNEKAFNSALINCTAVTSKLHNRQQLLWTFQLMQPCITAAQQIGKIEGEMTNSLRVSASTKRLTFASKQDALALMEVVEAIIRDEVAQMYGLIEPESLSKHAQDSQKEAKTTMRTNINFVALLGGYTITVPLLQSLTYKVSGAVTRAACVADLGKKIVFDFDVKENSHEMQINVKDTPRSISVVEIPPLNGQVTSQMQDEQHVLTVLSSIEVIKLDASAIYSLLAALNRPQISDEIKDIQNQMKTIQENISDVFGKKDEDTATKESKPLLTSVLYDVHFTLAGLETLAKTSTLQTSSDSFAQLLLSLGTLHIQASNKGAKPGILRKYPEVHVDLRHMGFDIRRGTKEATRSCGSLHTSVNVYAGSQTGDDGKERWTFNFLTEEFYVDLSPETVSTFVDIAGYLGSRIKDLDTSKELDYLKKLRQSRPQISITDGDEVEDDTDLLDSVLAAVTYQVQLRDIRICWRVTNEEQAKESAAEDLELSIQLIEFGTRTRKSARLTIDSFLLQMLPAGGDTSVRSFHSALLPELTFNVAYLSTSDARRLAFQAVGKSLDLRLTSNFIVPAANLIESISLSAKNVQNATAKWSTDVASASQREDSGPPKPSQPLLGNKRLESLLLDADFAGAVVTIMGKNHKDVNVNPTGKAAPAGKYGQFDTTDSSNNAMLRSPGLAWKAEYRDNGQDDPTLQGEIRVDASNNILYPAVVPLVLDIVSSVKEVVSKTSDKEGDKKPEVETKDVPNLKTEKSGEAETLLNVDPEKVIGKLKLNLGLRIAKQEFTLSCQPIARVAATTSFDSVYFTLNTIASQEQGTFLAISGILTNPQASVQHVYSRDSTAKFKLDTLTLSFMNSKHVSGISGVSAIINVSPMMISVNARQAQDFFLFREIWYPEELRYKDVAPVAKMQTETSQGYLVQRYQQVAATAAFPWTATISIAALDINVDLGQAIGKPSFRIQNFWVSSKKTSDWEQNLCLGFEKIGIDSTGRLSGFIALERFQMRTSIQWPKREEALNETPLVQASLAFQALQVKAAFDYQAFLVADITKLEFLMYNVRESREGSGDRLVAIFNGDAVQMFGTTTSAAQVVAVYQALKKLLQENQENFESSLKEIEKFMSRRTSLGKITSQPRRGIPKLPEDDTLAKSPISLDTDVVVTLRALNLGIFPSTFSDHQVFKMEALNAYARFAASIEQRKVHTLLRMTLGQLRIGLAGVRNAEAPRTLSEMKVEDVVERSTGARGGTILKVPQVEAVMETWQAPKENNIDYKFKSAFEGKVEVGWNYSRVSYIRGMWANHNKMLEQTWGRQLPMPAVKITGVPTAEGEQKEGEQGKITAEVNVPQSKYTYTALEAPVIETPQLRDMGEATPPLEWIGLNRDRLPNLTHQIVIVSLLELAGEVEDAYSRILGSS